jgi:hypothetical protein
MFLIQALNGYHIKDKENEEVDVLDIASDWGDLQPDHELEFKKKCQKLTDNGPAWEPCGGCTSESAYSCNSSYQLGSRQARQLTSAINALAFRAV